MAIVLGAALLHVWKKNLSNEKALHTRSLYQYSQSFYHWYPQRLQQLGCKHEQCQECGGGTKQFWNKIIITESLDYLHWQLYIGIIDCFIEAVKKSWSAIESIIVTVWAAESSQCKLLIMPISSDNCSNIRNWSIYVVSRDISHIIKVAKKHYMK